MRPRQNMRNSFPTRVRAGHGVPCPDGRFFYMLGGEPPRILDELLDLIEAKGREIA